jgi:predicted outer membrane repeat protein
VIQTFHQLPNFPLSPKGGAIGIAGSSTVAEFIDVIIERNVALIGGAIYTKSGTISFVRSVVKLNLAVGPKMVIEKGGCTSVGACVLSVRLSNF